MPFVLTFPWRRFVLAMRDRHRTYQNEIAIFGFSVTAKDFSHGVLLGQEDRRFIAAVGRVPRDGTSLSHEGNRYSYVAPRETRVIGTDLVRGKLFDAPSLKGKKSGKVMGSKC